MGTPPSKPVLKGVPEIVGSTASVKRGQEITLRCEANCGVYGKWKKADETLEEGGRISITQSKNCKHFKLTIKDASEEDEGHYTLEIRNYKGKMSSSVNIKVLDYEKDWRRVNWGKEKEVKKLLEAFQPRNQKVKHLRFLLHGPVTAGKSSIINSIQTVFQGRTTVTALAAAHADKSHTKSYRTYKIEDHQRRELPFVFSDFMGLETDEQHGVLPQDIISALKGHLNEGYTFNPTAPLTEGNHYYNSSPTLDDKVHCLVSVIQGDTITLLEDTDRIFQKMREIREAANELRIPQVVIMTHVDKCCPVVKEDLKQVYFSKTIKHRMQHCSNKLGVPMNCIFPIKNYHEENNVDAKIDCLILDTLKNIINFADDYVGNN